MCPVIRVSFLRVGDKVGGIEIILDEPAAPEIANTFLVTRGADDAKGVEVDGALNDVSGFRGFGGDEDGVTF